MSTQYEDQILKAVSRKSYSPLKPKALARSLGLSSAEYRDFKQALKKLINEGRLELGRNDTIRPAPTAGSIVGTFRRTSLGHGYVRPQPVEGKVGPEIRISEQHTLDAASGDTVLVRLIQKGSAKGERRATGRIARVLERATREFVGTYHERDGTGYVRIDGTVFSHSIVVGDAGAKGAKIDDKVVIEMVRFPSAEDRGEGVITEVLGPRGQPGVDTLSIIRAFNLPTEFPEDAKEEARHAAETFTEEDIEGREDFTQTLIVTVDPVDARDFDDAVALSRDPQSGYWELQVHIADVGHFVPQGGPLDLEAKRRATSVYLPQRVLPMFPELISNHLASLQQDRVRYVKSVIIGYTPEGQITGLRFANGAIRVRRRFAYEEVLAVLEGKPEAPALEPEIRDLLFRMKELALILRERRRKRGSLELNMPEAELEYDEEGRVSGAHFASDDISHQIIEEFMLQANEAVAEHLQELKIPFLRRIHPDPDPRKLEAFARFARSLGYRIPLEQDRYGLQRVLNQSADKPEAHAIHYALLRSLKQATYSPEEDGHYALASTHYCHFTSPIRRYPDLTVHRLLHRLLLRGKVGGDREELATLGDHCSKMERRSEIAERELVKLKLLAYLEERLGLEMEAIISGVADYGFYAMGTHLPAEGLVHISTLPIDYYWYDEDTHTIEGERHGQRYRLGDRVKVQVVRVDMQRRQLNFRLVTSTQPQEAAPPRRKRPR
jgi:ribonuclease R